MSGTVSITFGAHWLGMAAFGPYDLPGSAMSGEACDLESAELSIARFAEEVESLLGTRKEALRNLYEVALECADADWDAAGALPVDPLAVETAADLIRALPDSLPVPEVAPEPDGGISLDWIQSRHRLFSLSVGSDDRLAYAWLDGTDKGHGVSRFDGTEIPARVLALIESILSRGDASVRSA